MIGLHLRISGAGHGSGDCRWGSSLAITSLPPKWLLAILLFLARIRFLLTAAVNFGAGEELELLAGMFGLITGFFSIYGGLALGLKDTRRHTICRCSGAVPGGDPWREACATSWSASKQEAGVREQS